MMNIMMNMKNSHTIAHIEHGGKLCGGPPPGSPVSGENRPLPGVGGIEKRKETIMLFVTKNLSDFKDLAVMVHGETLDTVRATAARTRFYILGELVSSNDDEVIREVLGQPAYPAPRPPRAGDWITLVYGAEPILCAYILPGD